MRCAQLKLRVPLADDPEDLEHLISHGNMQLSTTSVHGRDLEASRPGYECDLFRVNEECLVLACFVDFFGFCSASVSDCNVLSGLRAGLLAALGERTHAAQGSFVGGGSCRSAFNPVNLDDDVPRHNATLWMRLVPRPERAPRDLQHPELARPVRKLEFKPEAAVAGPGYGHGDDLLASSPPPRLLLVV